MAAQLTDNIGRSARTGLVHGACHEFLTGPAFAADQHAAGRVRHAADLGLESLHRRAFADQLVEVRGLGHQPVVIGGQQRLLPSADQGHDQHVGHRNGNVEIALREPAPFEIQMQGPERGRVVHQRHADGFGKMIERAGGAGVLGDVVIVDPDRVSFATHDLRERLAQTRLARRVGREQLLRFQFAVVTQPEESDHRGARAKLSRSSVRRTTSSGPSIRNSSRLN